MEAESIQTKLKKVYKKCLVSFMEHESPDIYTAVNVQ